ncbi:MAG TPA: extracellular solute-binding protein [Burkholderiaceae bacterium]
MLTLLAAPFSGVAPAVASSERGRTLTVAAFPAVDKIVAAAIPAWNKLHPDVELRLISRQRDDHHTAMTTALSTSAGLPDVMALEVPYLGRFKQGLGLEDLRAKPYDVEQLRSRLVPYAYQQATNKRGEVVGLPSDIGPGTLLYRHDVLSRAGLTEAQLTNTWDGFVESGVRIKASTGAYLLAHARDIKDIVIRAGIPPGAGLFFDQQSRVLVNTPRFHRAFALAKAVRAGKLDARVNAWSSDWAEGFKRGSIASQMMGAWLAGHLNSWLAPSTRGLWRAAQLPEGAYAAFGGTFFAMPRRGDAARKALAWDFLRLMALDRHQQLTAFKEQDAFPALVETFSDPFFEEPLPFLGGQRARLLWRDAAQRITAFNVHKQDAFADEVINTELDKVLDRGKDIATALGDAERLLKQRAMR